MTLCQVEELAPGDRSQGGGRKPPRRIWSPRGRLSPYAREIARGRSLIRLLDVLRPRDLLRPRRPDPDQLVTVVVPMFNAAPFVERCVKSLLIQTHRALHIMCVDDHSADDTYSRVVDQFGADRRVNVVRLRRNVGPYQIKNWVLSQVSRTELLAMQDADDVSHPLRLERQVAALESAGLDVCGTSVHQFFPAGLMPFFGDTRVLGPDRDNFMHSIATYPSHALVDGPVSVQRRARRPRPGLRRQTRIPALPAPRPRGVRRLRRPHAVRR